MACHKILMWQLVTLLRRKLFVRSGIYLVHASSSLAECLTFANDSAHVHLVDLF